MIATRKWQRRSYELTALAAIREVRTLVLFWARQCRKSTTLGSIAFDEMSRESGRNVIAASASLIVGSELVSKAISAAEQAAIVTREAAAFKASMEAGATNAGDRLSLKVANSTTGKLYQRLGAEDFTDLYRTSKLEMRLYHSPSSYSRLLVIAPNPATARGWTGMVVRDEAGFTRTELERDLRVAVKPIIDTDPSFKMIFASNLPNDDRHPFFEMTLPPPDALFPPYELGHFYRSQDGTLVHRVSLADAYAAGHTLYDTNSGKPLTYEAFCRAPGNKLGLNVSYRLIHEYGGTAAIDLPAILTAQRRGIGECTLAWVENEGDFLQALDHLMRHLGSGPVGIGHDLATTSGETSNPSSTTVTESVGTDRCARLVMLWKERDPKVARGRLARLVKAIHSRPTGGPAKRLCADATSEQYYARDLASQLAPLIPVVLVNASNSVEPCPAGYERPPNYKTLLGDIYAAQVNANRYTLPPEDYLKDDHRLVLKIAGLYHCDPEPDGKHGDTFDSGKLAEWALTATAGAIADPSVIRLGGHAGRPRFVPRSLPRR